ncbi:MAG: pyridoxamine 5'-phosphate oxidase family protein [Peptococcaceae bacterium]|nr:pyridoxamine 5'-phosphate oxidase family protein [Peptococcaceae bacterium]
MNKNELIAFIKANPLCHLATIEDGAPRVRAIMLYKAGEDGILIQTFKSKDLCKQLSRHPEIELCFNNHEAGIQVRVRGAVEPVEDAAAKKQCLEERPFLKPFADKGQEVALFRLKEGLAHIWTMNTNFDPKTYIKI